MTPGFIVNSIEKKLLEQHSATMLIKLLIECRIAVDIGEYPTCEARFLTIQEFLDHMDQP